MPHGKKTVKLSRTASHRDAMLANMAASLFLHSKVITTSPKAKALRPMVDRLITVAKEGSLHSKRQVADVVRNKAALKKLFEEIVPKFSDRSSGYSRVLKAGFRKGDLAEMSVVELTVEKPKEVAAKKESRLKRLSEKFKRSSSAKSAKEKKAAAAKEKVEKKKKSRMEEEPAQEETGERNDEAEGETEEKS